MLITLLLSCTLAHAASDIPPDCLTSFKIKDKTLNVGAQTLSCTQLEQRRVTLFKEINATTDSGQVNVDSVLADMQTAQGRLKKIQNDKNWADVAEIVGGHFIATVGFIACAETAGAGCAMAVVGKAFAIEQTIRMAANDAAKTAEVEKLRAQIAAWQDLVKGKKLVEASVLRSRLVSEFTGMCAEVKKSCL